MSCPECGLPTVRAGMSYAKHTQETHERARRRLYGAIRRLLDQETGVRVWRAENAAQGLVGFRWRCGAAQRSAPEERWGLRIMREHLTGKLQEHHGLTVNQATWFHRFYDDREEA